MDLMTVFQGRLHYWLQRAKSIYRSESTSKTHLLEAYKYAKKVYCDGWDSISAKAALSSGIICCLLHNCSDDTDEKLKYQKEAIDLIHAAIQSHEYIHNDELRKSRSSHRLILGSVDTRLFIPRSTCNSHPIDHAPDLYD